MNITRAEKKDWPLIEQIAQRSWRTGYASVLSAGQIEFMLAKSYSQEGLIEAMDVGQEFFLLFVESYCVGFITVFPKDLETLRIEKLYLLPETQGQGYGKVLVDFAVQYACRSSRNRLELNVNRKNTAYYFYLKQGFEVVQEIDIPYYGYILDDYIMVREL